MMAATERQVVVVDMSTLRFVWQPGRRSVTLLTANGELLAVSDVAEGAGERQAAFAVLEEAAATARVSRGGVEHRVAFYNPYTAEVSVDAATANRVFCAGRPLSLREDGEPAAVTEAALVLGSSELPERGELDPASAMRAVAAHLDLA
jgi:hypothetical protein